jgi:hypothetical protein
MQPCTTAQCCILALRGMACCILLLHASKPMPCWQQTFFAGPQGPDLCECLAMTPPTKGNITTVAHTQGCDKSVLIAATPTHTKEHHTHHQQCNGQCKPGCSHRAVHAVAGLTELWHNWQGMLLSSAAAAPGPGFCTGCRYIGWLHSPHQAAVHKHPMLPLNMDTTHATQPACDSCAQCPLHVSIARLPCNSRVPICQQHGAECAALCTAQSSPLAFATLVRRWVWTSLPDRTPKQHLVVQHAAYIQQSGLAGASVNTRSCRQLAGYPAADAVCTQPPMTVILGGTSSFFCTAPLSPHGTNGPQDP